MPPQVDALIAVHNGAQHIGEAVESLLGQTLGDIEVLVVDDASDDDTARILALFDDPRLRVSRNQRNMGLAASLNRGLAETTAPFVARLDADDVAEPDRLARQAAFLEAHPEVGLLGTGCRLIDPDGTVIGEQFAPDNDLAIRLRGLVGNPFFHPSVMIRRDVLDRHRLRYDENFETAQDYDLWMRILEHTRGANLPEPLTRLRVHAGQVSATRAERQREDHIRVARRVLSTTWPGHPFGGDRFETLHALLSTFRPLDAPSDRDRCRLIGDYDRLLDLFAERHAGAAGLEGVMKDHRIPLAYLALRPPWRSGLPGVLRRLFLRRPSLIPAFATWALRRTLARMGN